MPHGNQITVLLPIQVPEGAYCTQRCSEHGLITLCSHFDNEGGHSTCSMGFNEQLDVSEGTLKPQKCLQLSQKQASEYD